MKDSGCVQIDYGVESGSPRILNDIIGKKITVSQVKNAFFLSKKYGIRTLANFIVGLPSETKLDLKMTVDLAKKINADVYIFSVATPLPGTRLYDMIKEYIGPEEYNYIDFHGGKLTEKLNKSELKNLFFIRRKLQRQFNRGAIIKAIFDFRNHWFLISRPNRLNRLKFIASHLFSYVFNE